MYREFKEKLTNAKEIFTYTPTDPDSIVVSITYLDGKYQRGFAIRCNRDDTFEFGDNAIRPSWIIPRFKLNIHQFETMINDIDWYLNGNFICSTEERPYYKNLSADPVKEPLMKPLPALDRDISKKLDTLAMENCRSKEPKSFVDALVDCGVIPSDVPGEIIGVPKKDIKADMEALKQTAAKKSFNISDDKKE